MTTTPNLTTAEQGELAFLIASLSRRAVASPPRSSAAEQAREIARAYRDSTRSAASLLREARELSRKYRDIENYVDPVSQTPIIR